MGWKGCATECGGPSSRNSHTSTLYKALLTLKILHGSCEGAKGSKVDDIAMFMFKFFCLDGDIKSQVLATLKYGVNKNFITKKGDRYSLLTPAASIYLASCKCKKAEIKRVQCSFPATWASTSFDDNQQQNGKQKRTCQEVTCGDQDESICCPNRKKQKTCNSCSNCQQKQSHNNNNNNSCNSCRQQQHHKPKGHSCKANPCRGQNPGLCCPNLDKSYKPPCAPKNEESSEPSDSTYGCDDEEEEEDVKEESPCFSEESEDSCPKSPPIFSNNRPSCRRPPKRFEYCEQSQCSSVSQSDSSSKCD